MQVIMDSTRMRTTPIETGQIVKFHSPMPDENPEQVYVVLETTENADGKLAKIRALGTGLQFPPVNTVSAEDLMHAEVDASDIIGQRVIVETVYGKRIAGKVVKVWNDKVKAELTKIGDGVDSNVYLTVEDNSGDMHDGFLFVNPKT